MQSSPPLSALLIPPEYQEDVLYGGAEIIEKETVGTAIPSTTSGGRHPTALSYHLHILDAEERRELLWQQRQAPLCSPSSFTSPVPPCSSSLPPPPCCSPSPTSEGDSGACARTPPPTYSSFPPLLPAAAAVPVCQVHERYLQRLDWARAYLRLDRRFSRWLTCPEDHTLWPSAASDAWRDVAEAIRVLQEVEDLEGPQQGGGSSAKKNEEEESLALALALTTSMPLHHHQGRETKTTCDIPPRRRRLLALEEAWRILYTEATRPGVYPIAPVSVAGTLTPYLCHQQESSTRMANSTEATERRGGWMLPQESSEKQLTSSAVTYTRGSASALRANMPLTLPPPPSSLLYNHGEGSSNMGSPRSESGIYLFQMPPRPRLFSAMEILEMPLTMKAMSELVTRFYDHHDVGTDMKTFLPLLMSSLSSEVAAQRHQPSNMKVRGPNRVAAMDTRSSSINSSINRSSAAGTRDLWRALVGLHRSRLVQSAGGVNVTKNNTHPRTAVSGNGVTSLTVREALRHGAAPSEASLPLMGSVQDFLQSGWCGWSTQFSSSANVVMSGGYKNGGRRVLTATAWAMQQYQEQQQAAALLGIEPRSGSKALALSGSSSLSHTDVRDTDDDEEDDGEPESFLAERVRAAHADGGGNPPLVPRGHGNTKDKETACTPTSGNSTAAAEGGVGAGGGASCPNQPIRLQSGVYATVLHLLHTVCLFVTEGEEETAAAAMGAAEEEELRKFRRRPADWLLLDRLIAPAGSSMRVSLEQQLHMSLPQAWQRGLLRVFTRRYPLSHGVLPTIDQSSAPSSLHFAAAPPSADDMWEATCQGFWSPFIVAHHQQEQEIEMNRNAVQEHRNLPQNTLPLQEESYPLNRVQEGSKVMQTPEREDGRGRNPQHSWAEAYCAAPPQFLSLPSNTVCLDPAPSTNRATPSPASNSEPDETTRRTTLFVHAVRFRAHHNPFLLLHGDRVERGWEGRTAVRRALKRRREELPEAYEEQQLMASLRRRRGDVGAGVAMSAAAAAANNKTHSSSSVAPPPPPPCSLVGTELREAVRSTMMKVLAVEPLSKVELLEHAQMRRYAASPAFEPVVQALLKEGRSSQRIQYKGRKYELAE